MRSVCNPRINLFRSDTYHDFEPFYDTVTTSQIPGLEGVKNATPEFMESMKTVIVKRTYVKHVCRYCGETIFRDE